MKRGRPAVLDALTELHSALNDSSPEVRVAAAETLGRFRPEAGLQETLPILVEQADWGRHSVFTVMAALDSLEALEPKAAPVTAQIRTLPTQGPVRLLQGNLVQLRPFGLEQAGCSACGDVTATSARASGASCPPRPPSTGGTSSRASRPSRSAALRSRCRPGRPELS